MGRCMKEKFMRVEGHDGLHDQKHIKVVAPTLWQLLWQRRALVEEKRQEAS